MKVVYEDNHIIIVFKEANIPSQKDASGDKDVFTMTKEYIKEKYNKPGNVYLALLHRLDRPVSGLMLMAKTSKAAARLSKDFSERKIGKKYLAVVWNNGLKEEDNFSDYLIKENSFSKVSNASSGKLAELSYKIIDKNDSLALVEIDLKTGRHHQIRVQFASRACPIYGDQRYGRQDRQQIALMAFELSFVHPVSKKALKIDCLDATTILNKLLQTK